VGFFGAGWILRRAARALRGASARTRVARERRDVRRPAALRRAAAGAARWDRTGGRGRTRGEGLGVWGSSRPAGRDGGPRRVGPALARGGGGQRVGRIVAVAVREGGGRLDRRRAVPRQRLVLAGQDDQRRLTGALRLAGQVAGLDQGGQHRLQRVIRLLVLQEELRGHLPHVLCGTLLGAAEQVAAHGLPALVLGGGGLLA